jgi:hypothetical protein
MSAPRRNRGWLWFFLITFGLAAAASITLIAYNLRQQLKAEDLEHAWALWKQKAPADYDLKYTVDRTDNSTETYEVQVRHGRTVSLSRNGQPQESRLYSQYGMDGLFGWADNFLRQDSKPDRPRVYCRAVFDPKDGHIWWYVRRVMGTNERLEINVLELLPVGKG